MSVRGEAPETRKRMLPPAYLLLAIVAMSLLHLVLPLRQVVVLPGRLVGIPPLLLGLALNAAADGQFKQSGTTVKPFEKPVSLVTTGVYRVTRNPMYLGFILILLGVAILLGSLSAFFIVPPFAVLMEVVFIRREEHMIDATFGREGLIYQAKVRRWIGPQNSLREKPVPGGFAMNVDRKNGQVPVAEDDFYGRMNDPSAGAWVTGPCGDTMEFYLVIENDVIRKVKYHTDGCEFTRLCGRTVATYVQGKTLVEALSLSGKGVLDALPDLPPEHRHCAILAVNTLYRAIGQYWLEKAFL